jgi:ParB family transcriptional regulator, chromosome partitioning protein
MHEEVLRIPVDSVDASPYQPRRRFDEEKLEELAASIRQHGVIQPIVVRATGSRFELVAGERRLRAVRRLGLAEVPAIVRTFTDDQALEAALVENLQREDISVVEEARAYHRLAGEFHYSQAEIAQRTGKSRAAVNNTLRLLHLPDTVLEALDAGELTEGHGRALLALPYPSLQAELAEWIVRNAITVRETERKVRTLIPSGEEAKPGPGPPPTPADVHIHALEERLRRRFGTKVTVGYRRGRGTVSMEFYSDDDLCRVLELMGVGRE